MEEGFVLDQQRHNAATVSKWVEGSPEKRWWGLNIRGRKVLSVITFRCARCGYLESYTVSPEE